MTTETLDPRPDDRWLSRICRPSMAEIGRRAREAAVALSLASAAIKDRGVAQGCCGGQSPRSGHPSGQCPRPRRGWGAGPVPRVARPARPRPQTRRGDRRRTGNRCRTARPGRPCPRRVDAAERSPHPARSRCRWVSSASFTRAGRTSLQTPAGSRSNPAMRQSCAADPKVTTRRGRWWRRWPKACVRPVCRKQPSSWCRRATVPPSG